MQREEILKKLREQGCRITKQRQLLLDIILQEEYSCCKEIYYKAAKQDSSIWYCDRLPYDKYIGGYRCNQQKYHVPH